VEVLLHRNSSYLHVEIRDDGRGIDPERAMASASYGLAGMRKRAQQCGASLDIRSVPGEGTVLKVEVPIEEGNPEVNGGSEVAL
jgi:signal transduction histidine kinase